MFALVALELEAAGAWPRKKPPPEPEVVAPPPPPPAPRLAEPLFAGQLPVDLGALPDGLANVSAQGCHACHDGPHAIWSAGGHGSGEHSATPVDTILAVAEGDPACLSCHLPLTAQHPAPDGWDASLQLEGVTCAACHVREGTVVVSTQEAARAEGAPHPVAWSPDLSSTCRACHQASWPDASEPLYDTWGEWERSAWAGANVGCADCHVESGHLRPPDPARAFSLLVRLESPTAVRAEAATVDGAVELQNTGAGHAVPTGTPFRGLRVRVALTGPAVEGEEPVVAGEPLEVDLARTLAPEAPFATVKDTRLQAGESRSIPFSVPMPLEAPAGMWELSVAVLPTLRGEVDGDPIVQRTVPLLIE